MCKDVFIAAQTPWVCTACLLALCFCAERATSRAAATKPLSLEGEAASWLGVAGCLTSGECSSPCTGAVCFSKKCPSHLQLVTLMPLLYEDVPWGLRKFGASGLRVPRKAARGIRTCLSVTLPSKSAVSDSFPTDLWQCTESDVSFSNSQH